MRRLSTRPIRMTSVARASAFTLVELLVVITIIALLISIMIPGFSAVRNTAHITSTQATFQGIDRGVEGFRGERALGGAYPPSQTDNVADGPDYMNNPFNVNPVKVNLIAGANLLVYALVGADNLGTPGFFDLNKNGTWWDDQGANVQPPYKAAYALDTSTNEVLNKRYPSGGGAFVDDTTRSGVRSYQQLFDDGIALTETTDLNAAVPQETAKQLVFTDSWGRPVLYYRANRAGQIMVHNPAGAGGMGVYDLRDNKMFTGLKARSDNLTGVDFGPGPTADGFTSEIHHSQYPAVKPTIQNDVNVILENATFKYSFERFILDRSITQQNRPVNAQKYLLISAGPDAQYGTGDDVTNWDRGD